jgi:hypothetical protein
VIYFRSSPAVLRPEEAGEVGGDTGSGGRGSTGGSGGGDGPSPDRFHRELGNGRDLLANIALE